jgi:hypothetical protein
MKYQTALAAALAAVVLPSAALADNACQTIAQAKFQQWEQPRILRQAVYTMPDGNVKKTEEVFTQGVLYAFRNGVWRSGPLDVHQHQAPSAEAIARNLDAVDCERAGTDTVDGEPVDIYTYNTNSNHVDAKVTVWVSARSGLPLRTDMEDATPQRHQAASVSARYVYNADVVVPARAIMADTERRHDWQQSLVNLQLGKSASY